MVNDIIDGISNALYSAFDDVKIYSEEIEQGVTEPCFFIMLVDDREAPLLGNRAVRTTVFDVHYFPEKGDDLKAIASDLYPILRRVKLLNNDFLNGVDLNYRITDNVLHFFVTFKPIVYYVKDNAEDMEDLTLNQGVNYGN